MHCSLLDIKPGHDLFTPSLILITISHTFIKYIEIYSGMHNSADVILSVYRMLVQTSLIFINMRPNTSGPQFNTKIIPIDIHVSINRKNSIRNVRKKLSTYFFVVYYHTTLQNIGFFLTYCFVSETKTGEAKIIFL